MCFFIYHTHNIYRWIPLILGLLILFVLVIILWKFSKSKKHLEPGLLSIEMEGIERETKDNIEINNDDIKHDFADENQNETMMGQDMDNISFNKDIPNQDDIKLEENMDDLKMP